MNVVHDQLADGRTFRVVTVIDRWHRHCAALEAVCCLTGGSVVEAMTRIALERDLAYAITVDHGPAFTSKGSTNGIT